MSQDNCGISGQELLDLLRRNGLQVRVHSLQLAFSSLDQVAECDLEDDDELLTTPT